MEKKHTLHKGGATMKTLADFIYDIRIGRRLEKLNRRLALEDVIEFERAIAASRRQTIEDVKTVKAISKRLVKALKTA